MDPVKIPLNYWDGREAISCECPWLTPGAIHELVKLTKRHHSVLEFGSGGSTLFFSRRVTLVKSFETDPRFQGVVRDALKERNLENVQQFLLRSVREIVEVLQGQKFDLILVDCEPSHFSRRLLIELSPSLLNQQGYVIVDNYGMVQWCGDSYSQIFPGWERKNFDDSHWTGNGTAIFYQGQILGTNT